MKKKFMALCLTFIFLINVFSFVAVQAATTYSSPLKNFILAKYSESSGIGSDTVEDVFKGTKTIAVPTDITLKASSEATYVNGPVTMTDDGVNSVDFKANIDMSAVKTNIATYRTVANSLINNNTDPSFDNTALTNDMNTAVATGRFIIAVKYPANFTIPAAMLNGTAMYGFSSQNVFSNVFEETVPRTVSVANAVNGKAYKVLRIYVDVKPNVTLSVLENYLDNLTLTCEGVTVAGTGKFSVIGLVSGSVNIVSTYSGSPETIGRVIYNFIQEPANADAAPDNGLTASDITGTVVINAFVPGPGTRPSANKYALNIIFGDEIPELKFSYTSGTTVNLDELVAESMAGKKVEGYYLDEEFSKPVESKFLISQNTTVYVKWVDEVLDSTEHFAYVIGYPVEETGRDEVRPENNISREEIATIFYRLLKTDERDKLFTAVNNFTDVEKSRWSNKAISTMANGGYIIGYEDGSFNPEGFITRAEFVTIAARFYKVDESTILGTTATFPDISSHWAENYIKYALGEEWIQGYDVHNFVLLSLSVGLCCSDLPHSFPLRLQRLEIVLFPC